MVAIDRRRPDDNEEFYRRFTAPEERKQRIKPWCGGFRWFASENVLPLEQYRTEEDWTSIRDRFWPKKKLANVVPEQNFSIKIDPRFTVHGALRIGRQQGVYRELGRSSRSDFGLQSIG